MGTAETLRWMSFRIPQLDCHDEILLIQQLLSDCPGIVQLECDVLQRRIDIRFQPGQATGDELVDRLSRAGMTALPWQELDQQDVESFWQLHGRAVMTLCSGVLLLIAALSHLVASMDKGLVGFSLEAPSGAAVILLAGSILAAFVHVVPRALTSIRHLRADMNLLMLIAVLGAIAIEQWLEGAMVGFLFSLALWIEQRATERARESIKGLMQQTPRMARSVERPGADARELPVQRIEIGQRIEVWPGEQIPMDGVVMSGATYVDQAAITGESMPLAIGVGDQVYAGTLNVNSSIQVEVTHKSDDTTLARTLRLVEQAQTRRAPIQRWVEVFASRYTPLVMGLAVAVMLLPPLILPIVQLPGVSLDRIWDTWFYRGLVVLVISCPCALVISTPVAVVAGITTAVRRGVLVKGGEFLEAMANVRAIAFDKTGTLTVGTPLIEQLVPIGETNSRDLLSLAAALEVASIHPLAEAIRSHASSEEVEYSAATDCTVHHGEGVTGSVAGEPAWIGKPSWAAEQAELSDDVQQTVEGVAAAGLTTLVVGRGVQPIGVIGIADPIRPETDQVMAELRQHGVGQLLMLTGDGDAVAKSIADQAGLESYKAGLMPNEKADEVAQLKDGKGTVVMVGDGVNDSPAMARATVGISMASIGSQHAIATSDIALMSDDLGRIPWLIDHARRTLRVIRQNTTLAIMLKLLCLAATIAGFCSLWIAIAADTGATLLVTSNSLRLFSR